MTVRGDDGQGARLSWCCWNDTCTQRALRVAEGRGGEGGLHRPRMGAWRRQDADGMGGRTEHG